MTVGQTYDKIILADNCRKRIFIIFVRQKQQASPERECLHSRTDRILVLKS